MTGRGWAATLTLLLSVAATAAPPDKAALCESCHGKGGNSVTAGIPSIAGQPATFLENQLVYFREGLRSAPVMQPLMQGVKDEEIAALARHFSTLPATAAKAAAADPALVARGREIAVKRHCGQCHLPDYRGRNQMPRLAGQREDYLLSTMLAYRDDKRTGADTTMIDVLAGLSDADVKALAAFIVQLPP